MKLVISGGGTRISYLLGIKKYIEKNNILIDEYSGTSSGSLIIVLMVCNISNNIIIEHYKKSIKYYTSATNKLELLKDFLNKILPSNAYVLCTKKVHISISEFKFPFLKNNILSTFTDNNHLINTILSSCSFPYFINTKLFYDFYNILTLDGFFTNNTPLIEPNNSTNQIIVKTYLRTIYDLDIFSFKPINEKIINIGYNDMHQFITNQKCLLVSHNDYNTNIFVMFLLIFIILKSIKSFLVNINF